MMWLTRILKAGGLAGALVLSAPASAQDRPVVTPDPNGTAHEPQEFEGAWIYNPTDSVNAATGRPERAPRSATQRAPANPTGGNRGGGGAASPPASGVANERAGGQRGSRTGLGFTPEMMQETRSLSRDLLEISEALRIQVLPDSVTLTDDLDRERSYSTAGAKQKYQLGAARFEAVAEWNGSRLLKRIEGPYGFRMTETYFLSSDGQRLFVIIRVGEPKKGQPPVGVNRVYDRVE